MIRQGPRFFCLTVNLSLTSTVPSVAELGFRIHNIIRIPNSVYRSDPQNHTDCTIIRANLNTKCTNIKKKCR